MPWIHQVPEARAEGRLAEQYRRAKERAGRVWNIIRIMSLNPEQLDASMNLYLAIMHGESPLSRRQREMLATVVASELACPY